MFSDFIPLLLAFFSTTYLGLQLFSSVSVTSFAGYMLQVVPEALQIVLIVLAIVFGLVLLPGFIISLIAGYLVYYNVLKKKSKDEWGRQCSIDEPRHIQMYDEGMEWHSHVKDRCTEVHIVNEGLNLYGEYYDFGSDCCMIFLPGRMESLHYAYYFDQPYEKAGINILSIDPRCHGLSDGTYNTIGFEEWKDALAWARYIHDQFGVKKILFHGICIGAAGGVYALASESCPDYCLGIIADGLFAHFSDSMKNHLIERNKPVFPTMGMIDFWMWHYTRHRMTVGPMDYMEKFDKAILFLHSKADMYSVPKNTQKMYDMCGSQNKKIVWFENSQHSMIRYDHTKEYDEAVIAFAKEVFQMN